jgi:hypothetical protein
VRCHIRVLLPETIATVASGRTSRASALTGMLAVAPGSRGLMKGPRPRRQRKAGRSAAYWGILVEAANFRLAGQLPGDRQLDYAPDNAGRYRTSLRVGSWHA